MWESKVLVPAASVIEQGNVEESRDSCSTRDQEQLLKCMYF